MTKNTQAQQTELELFVQKYGKVKRLAERLDAGELVQLREIAGVLGEQATAEFKSLHILEQREHSFWANVNSDSDGT